MRKHILATTLLIPATALATALPAHAQFGPADTGKGTVQAQAVQKRTAPGAAPLKALRSTGQSCSGQNVWRQTVSEKGRPIGQLDVYYKSGNKGTLIACFKHVGATKCKRLPTAVSIAAAKSQTATQPAVQVTAAGNFRSYAGPAVVGGANGQCVVAAGSIKYAGKTYLVTSPVLCDK